MTGDNSMQQKAPNSRAKDLAIVKTSGKVSTKTMLIWGIVAFVLAASWQGAEMRPWELVENYSNMAVLLADFFPPDFSDLDYYISEMVITVQIALWGTFLSALLGIPLGLLSSENLFGKVTVNITRRLMDITRSINEVVLAMIFVAAIGLGPFAGVLAIFFHTTGVFAKLFSEAVEAIEMGQLEGIRSVGATKTEEIIYGVLPQVSPLWLSFILYRFESNVRGAAVLGIVGAGGIGTAIFETLGGFMFQKTCVIMVVIIIFVNTIDYLSLYLRKKFI